MSESCVHYNCALVVIKMNFCYVRSIFIALLEIKYTQPIFLSAFLVLKSSELQKQFVITKIILISQKNVLLPWSSRRRIFHYHCLWNFTKLAKIVFQTLWNKLKITIINFDPYFKLRICIHKSFLASYDPVSHVSCFLSAFNLHL